MKKLVFILLMLPLMAVSQNKPEVAIYENALLTPKSGEEARLMAGLKAHNQKFHAEGEMGARVYYIMNGPHTGSLRWIKGGFSWGAMDNPSYDSKEHADDWNENVRAHITPWSGQQTYWKANPELSQFPRDFTIKYMEVTYYDIARGKYEKFMKLVKKGTDVYHKNMPNEIFGIYTNAFPSTKDGRDIAFVSFFNKASWLGDDNSLKKPYEETYGEGSWDDYIEDWVEVTNGSETEVRMFLPKQSGISGEVKVSSNNQ